MASQIDRRLRELEEISGIAPPDPADEERRIRQEALRRLSFEELTALEDAAGRLESGDELLDEDREILRKDDDLREVIRNELTGV